MPLESRLICVCLFLHLTDSLMYQCLPFSVTHQKLKELSVLSCAHGQSLRDSYVRTRYSGLLQEDLSCTALPDVTHLTRYWQSKQQHHLRDLGIGCLPQNPSLRGGRRKWRKIAVVCNGASRLTTQPLNNLLQLPSSTRRSVSNLTAVVPLMTVMRIMLPRKLLTTLKWPWRILTLSQFVK